MITLHDCGCYTEREITIAFCDTHDTLKPLRQEFATEMRRLDHLAQVLDFVEGKLGLSLKRDRLDRQDGNVMEHSISECEEPDCEICRWYYQSEQADQADD